MIGAQPANPVETGAYTFPAQGLVYLPIESFTDLDAYLPHELTHVVFHQHGDTGHIQSQEIRFYPLWLDEGLAEHDVPANNLETLYDQQTLQQAVSSRSLVDIYSIFNTDYPLDVNTDYLCYAEASAYMGYLIKTYGLTKFHRFVDGAKNGAINLAAETNFGMDLQTLRSQWVVSLGLPAIAHSAEIPLVTPTAVIFTPGKTGGVAVQTKPFTVIGEASVQSNVQMIGGIALLLAVILLVTQLLLGQRRKQARVAVAVTALPVAPTFAEDQPYPTGASAPYPPSGASPPRADGSPTASYAMPYSYPSYQAADVPTAPLAQPSPPFPWLTAIVAGLLAPVVLGVTYLWPALDASMLWRHRYLAANVAAGLLLLALVTLLVVAASRKRVTVLHVGSVVLALAILPAIYGVSSTIGRTQAIAYEQAGAYALAATTLTDAGSDPTILARIDNEWATADLAALDYAAATTHLRAAVTANPTNQAYRAQLTKVTDAWGMDLIEAHQFAQASAAYDMLQTFAGCDKTCQPVAQQGDGLARLGQSSDDLFKGNAADALTIITHVAHTFPQTAAAKSAQIVLNGQHNTLSAAYATSDLTAMNLLLLQTHVQHPHTLLATEASQAWQQVSGALRDYSGASTGQVRVFFLAFATQTAAENWFQASTDTGLFKVATTTADDGTWQVRLQPGYWYLTIWDDPSQASNYYFNSSKSSDLSVFKVVPYQTTSGISILGY